MLNVLVIGAGNYVCGRGTAGFGTILPALCEWKRRGHQVEVTVAGATAAGISQLRGKLGELEVLTGVELGARFLPVGDDDENAYLRALSRMSHPACAIIVVPDEKHARIAIDAMNANLHVLVVKPLAPTVADALKMIEVQNSRKVYAAVEFHKRWDAANLKLRDCYLEGVIGDPQYVIVEYSQRKSVPSVQFRGWAATTNSFQYLGVHYVDIIYFVTSSVPRRVMAVGQAGWLKAQGIDAYDSVQGIIEWETPSGLTFTSSLFTNWIDPETTSAVSDQRIRFIGSKGRFESDQKRRGIQIVSESGIEEPNPDFCSSFAIPGRDVTGYRGYGIESLHAFLQDVESISQGLLDPAQLEGQRPTFREAIVSTAVVESANQSLANGSEWTPVKSLTRTGL